MVEADSHLELLPLSIFNIHNVFEHIDMLSIGIKYQPYTVITTLLAQILGSHLALLPLSILNIYKVFEHIDMLSIGIW
jgi:hypothetical protein